jgi:DNA-binding MarR family transcriptional regulator
MLMVPNGYMLELPQLLERMHRRYLDVVRQELTKIGARDINPVQVMMLATIGQAIEMSVRDLIDRGYYLGSNASYNIKNLTEGGYIERLTDVHDRRSARVRLTDKGIRVLDHLKEMDEQMAATLMPDSKLREEYKTTVNFLRAFERECSGRIQG